MRLILSLLLLFSCLTHSLEPSVRFERFSMTDGLSQNNVKSIVEDSRGFLWIATYDGLNRYDGYEFKVYRKDPNDPFSISDNQVNVLFIDNQQQLWAGTANGLNRYDPETDRFIRIRHYNNDPSSYDHNNISDIAQDENGIMWIATFDGLKMYDPFDGCFERFSHHPEDPGSLANNRLRAVYVDTRDRVWVGTDGGGLDQFDRRTGRFRHFYYSNKDNSLSNNRVTSISQDQSGALWVGTMNGLNRISSDLTEITRFFHQPDVSKSLAHNVVVTVNTEEPGKVYVGTIGGVSIYNPMKQGFSHWRYDPNDLNSLNDNSVWSIKIDSQGVIWVGSNLGLNRYNAPAQRRFDTFDHHSHNAAGLSHSNVTGILKDQQQRLWVATSIGLNRLDPDKHQFIHYRHDSEQPDSLADDRVFRIYQDSNRRIWVGSMAGLQWYDETRDSFVTVPLPKKYLLNRTVSSIVQAGSGDLFVGMFNSGLLRLDVKTAEVKQHYHPNNQSLQSRGIRALLFDGSRHLWIATRSNGLLSMDILNGTIKPFSHRFDEPQSLSNNALLSLFIDRDKQLWIGTNGGGLNRFDPATKRFIHYREKDGLPNDYVHAIKQDNNGSLWLSTNFGLARFDSKTKQFYHYDAEDGLQDNEFNSNAAFADEQAGLLYFGGVNGFNRFNPTQLLMAEPKATLVLTDFLLYNQPVAINPGMKEQQSKFELSRHIDYIDSIELSYLDNFFTINFAALHLLYPEKRQYAYRLRGWDKDWIYTSAKNRRATYTNIPAGSYVFEVKSADANGKWGQHSKQLKLDILPPPWQTWWAYSIYGALALGLLALFAVVRVEHTRAERERLLNVQLQQVDKLKDEFLANTSHELRTPLNGIIGLAESMIDGAAGQLPEKAKHNLAMVVSSGKRLANLVNDILDFSKLNNDSIELNRKPLDLHALVDVVLTLCSPLAANKNLFLVNNVPKTLPAADADEERISQVLHNLINNAIKFTDKGEVVVNGYRKDDQLVLSVSDTGIGMGEQMLENLFKSTQQQQRNKQALFNGTGLGLTVSRQLIELHGGTLSVESRINEGSCFSLSLPLTDKNAEKLKYSSIKVTPDIVNTVTPVVVSSAQQGDVEKTFRILLVDDEPVNRQVLLNHLSNKNYHLIEAAGGHQALDIINAQSDEMPFDLILLDIMMPQVSGFEVCQQVRKKYSINDLPIIFLTARSQASDMVQSFAAGANDYLSKPVAKHELLSRVETHLKLLDINRNLEAKVEQRTLALEQSNQRNTAINEICTQISSTLDLEQLRDTAYHHIKQLMDVYTFCIGFVRPDENHIEFSLVIEGGEYLAPFNVYMHEINRPAVWCVQNKQPLIINDYLRDHGKYFGKQAVPERPMAGTKVQSLVYWPLIVSDHLIGVLSVQSYEKNAYNKEHLDMISTLASTTAIAVDNANAYLQVEQKNKALVETQQQLLQQEKMASLGTLTAGVAHEINNPTNFVHVSAQNLEVDLNRAEQFFVDLAGDDADEQILTSFSDQFRPLHEHLTTIRDGTDRIKNIVKDLRLFTQLDNEDKTTVNVVECLESTLHLVKTKFFEVAEFVTDYQDDPQIQGYPSQLNQVLMNLIVNACDAIRDREGDNLAPGVVKLSCGLNGNRVEIKVNDNGCGMSDETKAKLFEPFYTTKSVGYGTGLGLSISYGIVQKHGGELKVSSIKDVGTEFVLCLPIEPEGV